MPQNEEKIKAQKERIVSSWILLNHLVNLVPIYNPSSLLEISYVKQLEKTKRIPIPSV